MIRNDVYESRPRKRRIPLPIAILLGGVGVGFLAFFGLMIWYLANFNLSF